ncbi:DUF5995 family protein [Kitasatospora sp. NPDC048298]|uniref:DUF5995 family protein n=1 Tax=Kitasatospora sp. NPDC048298 TaxID=3364049 RepID=UPI003710791E
MPDTAVDRTTAVNAEAETIEQVVGRLREIGAALPPADGVAVFDRLYLTVTEAVLERLGAGYFADPSAVAELDVVFARRYLRAVAADAAGQEPPACWRPLFALRAHPGVHPLQFAMAGMTAHIQHDLPLAVVDTCRRRGCGPADVEEDYRRINRVLAEVETAAREQLMPGPDLLELAEPLTHLLGAWSVGAARESAWGTVETLWGLRHLPGAARAFATALDGSVGLLGRALLLPLRSLFPPEPGTGDTGANGGTGDTGPEDGQDTLPGTGHPAPAPAATASTTAAATVRLPEARNRTARGNQAQLECSGLPSA